MTELNGGSIDHESGARKRRVAPQAWWIVLAVMIAISGGAGLLIERTGLTKPSSATGTATEESSPSSQRPSSRPSLSEKQFAGDVAGSNVPRMGHPDAATTGPRDGVALEPSGAVVVTEDGAIVEGLDVTGGIDVRADYVHIRNVQITTDGALYGIKIANDVTGTVIENARIVGDGNCSAGIVYAGYVARRIEVDGCVDGLRVGDATTVEASWIHDQIKIEDSHNDAVQSVGGRGIVLRGNRIEGPYQTSTSAVLLQADLAPMSDVVVTDNYLSGGSYSLYVQAKDDMPAPEFVRVAGNEWDPNSFVFGPASIAKDADVQWNRNTFTDGTAIE